MNLLSLPYVSRNYNLASELILHNIDGQNLISMSRIRFRPAPPVHHQMYIY
jgi:hypothetical protein